MLLFISEGSETQEQAELLVGARFPEGRLTPPIVVRLKAPPGAQVCLLVDVLATTEPTRVSILFLCG